MPFLLLLNVFCHADKEKRRAHWATPVNPHINLHQMDKHLYRSAMPDRHSLGQLKALGIHTVLNFYQQSDADWIGATNLQEIHLPMRMRHFDDEDALLALRSIRKAQQHGPVLIHCRHEQNRTGLVAALYRVIYQGWSKEQALAEMRGGFGKRGMKYGIRYLQTVDIGALKQALKSGACSTKRLAWCHLENFMQSFSSKSRYLSGQSG